MIKLVAFDWNGTLLADTKMVVKATNLALKNYGYRPISVARYKKTFTVPVVDFWLANGGKKEDMATEHYFFHPAYEKLAANAKTRKGVKEVLSWLQKNRIQAIIYSNHSINEINRKLHSLKIKKHFAAVLARKGLEDQIHLYRRHKQEKLADYLKGGKFKPGEIISVGDTCEEVEIGRNLHIKACAITGGENSTKRLKHAKPDFLIHKMKELIPIIKKLNHD